MHTEYVLTGSQLAFLVFLVVATITILGGFVHHETGHARSHGRVAYGFALIALFALMIGAFRGLDLGSNFVSNSFGAYAEAVSPTTAPVHPAVDPGVRPRAKPHKWNVHRDGYRRSSRIALDHLLKTGSAPHTP